MAHKSSSFMRPNAALSYEQSRCQRWYRGMMLEPPLTPPAPPLEREGGAFVFFSYAHRNKGFRDRLEEHLSNLKYRGLITTWYDREISAGEEWAQQIDLSLNKAHVILLLISA